MMMMMMARPSPAQDPIGVVPEVLLSMEKVTVTTDAFVREDHDHFVDTCVPAKVNASSSSSMEYGGGMRRQRH